MRAAGAAPAWAFRRAVAVAMLCVLAGFALGRADVVVLGVPFALYAAVAWARAAAPRLRASLLLDRDRVLEGETVVGTVRLHSDVDLDAVTVSLALPHQLRAVDPLTRTVAVRADVPCDVDVRLQALRWGRHQLGPARVSPHGPHLGSTAAAVDLPGARITVIGTQERFHVADLTPYALAAAGGHRSRRHGDGLEFAAVRPFAFGDRVRQVNWRVTARLGDLHVNDTLTDRMSEVVVLLDAAFGAGRSGGVHGAASSLDVTVRAAGAIATHYLRAGDTVSLVEFGGHIRDLSGLHGRGAVTRALDWLVDTTPGTLGWDVQGQAHRSTAAARPCARRGAEPVARGALHRAAGHAAATRPGHRRGRHQAGGRTTAAAAVARRDGAADLAAGAGAHRRPARRGRSAGRRLGGRRQHRRGAPRRGGHVARTEGSGPMTPRSRFAGPVLRRTGTGVALVVRLAHLVLAVATSAFVVAAVPSNLPLSGFVVVVAVVAVLGTLDSSGVWSTGTLVLLVVEYLVAVASARSAAAGMGVLAAVVTAVYLVHATGALAAVLPPGSKVARGVLVRWALSTATVVVAGLAFMLAFAVLPSVRPGVGWLVVGALAVAALLLLPALAFRRRGQATRGSVEP
ncbi:MAG: DUF58 domain-containing protein [Streptosporangiales bacterium]|nr:DUF58 domain-containing protein [Streptosporangiales bacterium]